MCNKEIVCGISTSRSQFDCLSVLGSYEYYNRQAYKSKYGTLAVEGAFEQTNIHVINATTRTGPLRQEARKFNSN